MGLHWMLLTVSCAIALTNCKTYFIFLASKAGGTAVASRRLKRPKPRPKGQNGVGKKSKRGMLAQLRPGPALIYCKSDQMSDSSSLQSTPFDLGNNN
jgi:hypothetical protein